MRQTKMTSNHVLFSDDVFSLVCELPHFGQSRGFKFCRSEHAQSMIERGFVRIGSLSDFRRHESATTKDIDEGVDVTIVNKTNNITQYPETGAVRRAIRIDENSQNNFFEHINIRVVTRDMFVYCFSYECNANIAATFDYEAVVEICDVYRLAENLISLVPELRDHVYLCAPVAYTRAYISPLVSERNPLCSVFEKDSLYKNNVEGRIVFVPREINRLLSTPFSATPILFENKKLGRLFRQTIHPQQQVGRVSES